MRTSMMSVTPASAQALISFSRIARDAFATSIVFSPTPSQKRFRPELEPPDSTTGVGKSKFSPKASATIDAYGRTVDDPAICTWSRAAAVVTQSAERASAEVASLSKDMDVSCFVHLQAIPHGILRPCVTAGRNSFVTGILRFHDILFSSKFTIAARSAASP